MEAKDLRIGNLVYNHDEIVTVEEIQRYMINYDEEYGEMTSGYSITNLKGIPLTEEWLVRFGFVKNPKADNIYDRGRLRIWGHLVYLREEDTEAAHYIPTEVKNVHELQNLYFALTSQELEVKQIA